MGVASGYTATIVDALKRQLDIGIDSIGTYRRPALTPRTGGEAHRHQRRRPPSPVRPAATSSSLFGSGFGFVRSALTIGVLAFASSWVWTWFAQARAVVLAD